MMFSNLFTEDPYPDELLNLYNPAYVGSVVYLAGRAFQAKAKRSVPIYFPFVMFPLIAVDSCRKRLPQRTGKLSDWARQHGDALFDFPDRVVALRPFVSSGLIFLHSHSLVDRDEDDGNLRFSASRFLEDSIDSLVLSSEEVRDELDRAPIAGRLLAAEREVSSVLAIFGLKP